ncbi:MAG: DUF502 domain-containing protein [Thermodesulfobacteriota bacterium]
MKSITSSIRQNILAGIVVLVPFGLTIFILFKLGRWVINWVSAAPARFIKPIEALPEPLFQIATFSIGLLGTIIIVLLIGTIARNFIGKKLVVFFEGLISRIPLARTVYIATKQIIETLFFAAGMKNLKRVALFEYPRKGIHSIGFITGTLNPGEYHNATDKKLYSIFVPTTPNPTSGYYIMVPAEDVTELNISVEDAFRLIVSAGLATNKIDDSK